MVIDASTIVKLLLFGAECIGNVFLCLMGAAAIWLTFAYKLQSHIYYIPLSGNQANWMQTFKGIPLNSGKFLHCLYDFSNRPKGNCLGPYNFDTFPRSNIFHRLGKASIFGHKWDNIFGGRKWRRGGKTTKKGRCKFSGHLVGIK